MPLEARQELSVFTHDRRFLCLDKQTRKKIKEKNCSEWDRGMSYYLSDLTRIKAALPVELNVVL